jgi:CBS domain-containing protein
MVENSFLSEISAMCAGSVGGFDKGFLCQSVSILLKRTPIVVREEVSLEDTLQILRANKIGCLGVVDAGGIITGIFSERDFILKIAQHWPAVQKQEIKTVMTKSPVTQNPDCTMAYALTLMSTGGFRHLPIVDETGMPLGILSLKDIVDFLVEKMTGDLMNFKES